MEVETRKLSQIIDLNKIKVVNRPIAKAHGLPNECYTNKDYLFFERKKILKQIIKSYLPKSLLKKKKSGFNTPIGLWFINNKQFKEMSHDLLSTHFMKSLFNYNELIYIWDSHQNMKIDQTYKIFNLISLSQWVINNKLENKI